jgi:hypothetical protein
MPDSSLSRDPLGGPELKCNQDQTFHPQGPASGVFVEGQGIVHPTQWLSLDGRPQATPDRNTRGYIDAQGNNVWLNVYPKLH